MATFPAQQRPPGDPELIARGKPLFVTNCSSCHGVDLRGGVTGGPNLLRSAVVLMDQHGELILPIVHGARAERGMPPLPFPMPTLPPSPNTSTASSRPPAVRGRLPKAKRLRQTRWSAMQKRAKSTSARSAASCHSPTGDLAGIGSRIDEAKKLQNDWVVGRRRRRWTRWSRRRPRRRHTDRRNGHRDGDDGERREGSGPARAPR